MLVIVASARPKTIFRMLSMQTCHKLKIIHNKFMSIMSKTGRAIYFSKYGAFIWLIFSLTGCNSHHDNYGKVTTAEQLWYKTEREYKTNDLRAYKLSLNART